MPPAALTYSDWKAPAEDGRLLVWPEPEQLLRETIDNRARLSATEAARVQNVPLAEVRRRARQWIGHADDAQPLIADGHQAELYHAGVWAKTVLANQAAARLGGQALHLAVDTDAPKHLHLRWPHYSRPVTDDAELLTAHWSGLLDAPTPQHLSELEQDLAAARFAEKPVLAEFLASLRRLALEQPKLSPAITHASHALDWDLGLRHHAAMASPLWESEPFLLFAHHVVARAGEFASTYNRALADYRREKKVRTPTRPMPDLAAEGGAIELPFWLDELATGGRTRPSALLRDGRSILTSPGGDEIAFDPSADGWDSAARLSQWLGRNELRLSPRALALTLFVRLCVADQFVHGIGGGQYDQITDRIIASHFGIEPPRFSVTTATMYLPEAAGRARVCVPCVEQEGHRLRHAVLGDRKAEFVRRIDAAPRYSPQRYAAFAEMHRALATAAQDHPAVRSWEQRLRETREREADEAVVFDRELFYGLQPRRRLEQVIDRYRAAFGIS